MKSGSGWYEERDKKRKRRAKRSIGSKEGKKRERGLEKTEKKKQVAG
jgi:hypothetical protein